MWAGAESDFINIFESHIVIKITKTWPFGYMVLTLSLLSFKVLLWTTLTFSIILAFGKEILEWIHIICKNMGLGVNGIEKSQVVGQTPPLQDGV